MKKILFGFSVFCITLVSAQNYPDYYPQGRDSDSYYGEMEDEFYFPDDYYYEYPADYYNNDLYHSYYKDYRQSISNVNWNRFFSQYRLSPYQMQQIMMLNNSFNSYAAWNSYYRYNPDRWYYDRFYALQRIMGPRTFVIFQNTYYRGYNPVLYYQDYNRVHYARNVYVVPRYRYVNTQNYRINRTQFHQTNPLQNIGFQESNRSGRTSAANSSFRDTTSKTASPAPQSFRNSSVQRNTSERNSAVPAPVRGAVRGNANGFRNDSSRKVGATSSSAPSRNVDQSPGNSRRQNAAPRTPASTSRNSGNSFTTR